MKKFDQFKKVAKSPQDRSVKRFQQNATRLEHSNVRNKNKDKKN